jgi:hypothetical protein
MTPVINNIEGKTLLPIYVDNDLYPDYIAYYSSLVPVEYEVDDEGEAVLDIDGNKIEKYTEAERTMQFLCGHNGRVGYIDKPFIKWQRRQGANAVDIKSGGISTGE